MEKEYKDIWDNSFPGDRIDHLVEIFGPGYDHLAFKDWDDLPMSIRDFIMGNP